MTGTAYPGDAVAGAPTYTATQGRTALAAAMGGATAARPLGGITGLRPGTPSSIFSVTSTTWTFTKEFGGYIDLESPANVGGYYFSFPPGETGAVTAAAGSARVDLVYTQINDSNTGDGSGLSPRTNTGYQAGVAGAGVPTLTTARAFVIAQINVPASGGGSPTFTWVTPYTVAAGGLLEVLSSAQYPTGGSPRQVFDQTLNYVLTWNGTAYVPGTDVGVWTAFTPTWTAANTAPSVGNGAFLCYYKYLGAKTVAVRYALTFGSTSNGGTGAWTFTLPGVVAGRSGAGEQMIPAKVYSASGTTTYVGAALVNGANTFSVYMPLSSTSSNLAVVQNATSGGGAGTGIPVVAANYTFTTGSNMTIEGLIEIQ
jgi:hypothetical protein